jgi:hypothetical protein
LQGVTVYRDGDFQGPSKFFPVGAYTFLQYLDFDTVGSVKVHGKAKATLFEVRVVWAQRGLGTRREHAWG